MEFAAGPGGLQASAEEQIRLGNAREDANDVQSALIFYERAIALVPTNARARLNVGNALARLGRQTDAESSYRKAIELDQDLLGAWYNLAGLLASNGNSAVAEQLLREVLSKHPAFAEADVALALIFESSDRPDAAEDCLRHALANRPDYAGAALNLGELLTAQGRIQEAIPYLDQSTSISNGPLSWMLFELSARTDLTPEQVLDAHIAVGQAITAKAGTPFITWTNSRNAHRPLKVGYVSSDFRRHPLGMLIKPVLAHHDHQQFEIFCYSDVGQPDEVTRSLQSLVENWRNTSSLDDQEFAEGLRGDGIDILVDLTGHGGRNRMYALARHPAPIQATWMGYLETSGLPAMDFRICDCHTDPVGIAEFRNVEKLIRLPNSQWCYEPWWAPELPPLETRTGPRIQFGSVNSSKKISQLCIDLWTEILHADPSIDLTILDVPIDGQSAMRARFGARGIDSARLFLHERQSIENYYRVVAQLDVALDTTPYSGATTTLDTLWMKTPIVALQGDRALSRSAFSVLSSAGLAELIAHDAREYVRLNVALAQSQPWRTELRSTLRDRLAQSPLMDTAAFVRDLERAYREMWLKKFAG